MAAQLQAAGIDINVDSQSYPNGRFACLHDPEGNPIETVAADSETRVDVFRNHESLVDTTVSERQPGTELKMARLFWFRSEGADIKCQVAKRFRTISELFRSNR
jgi:hypothetical protein